MKKIIIAGNSIIGLCKFRYELIEMLRKKGNEVFVLTPNDDAELVKNMENYYECSIDRRGINPVNDLKLIKNYYNFLKKIKPDIVLTYTIKPNIYMGLLCRILKIEYISNVTGLGTIFYKKGFVEKLVKFLFKISMKNTKKVFFQNEENLQIFLFSKIINKDKTILIPGSGVNLEKFYPLKKERLNSNKIFIFIGRIMKEKGIEEYLEVAKRIKEKYSETEFWILGMYEEKKYMEQIEYYEETGIVKYLGVTNDVRQWIKESDYLIQPSYHEGMSNVILEASAMGKLVLASNISGCKESIYNKKFLFEKSDIESLYNVVEMVLKNEIDYEKEAKIQSNYIKENFSREKVISKYLELIN